MDGPIARQAFFLNKDAEGSQVMLAFIFPSVSLFAFIIKEKKSDFATVNNNKKPSDFHSP